MKTLPRKVLARLLAPPDPALMEASAGGERLVARTRVAFWLFMFLIPAAMVAVGGATGANAAEVWAVLAGASAGSGMSVAILMVLRSGRVALPALGVVSSVADVTLISATLVLLAAAGLPLSVTGSQVAWAAYLLVILLASLRFDIRMVLIVGGLALAQYAALVAWIVLAFDVPVVVYSSAGDEVVALLVQAGRLMLMLAATGLAAGLTYRCQKVLAAASIDRLTGIANRAYFEERLAAELARCQRLGSPLVLLVFDIDHFKSFNDHWGHAAGDAALRTATAVLAGECRVQDLVARWGGEELALILPDTDPEGGRQLAERARRRIAAHPMPVGGELATVTVSCGLASVPGDATDTRRLFAKADARLMAAKHAGRNRVVADDLTPAPQTPEQLRKA